MVNAIPDPRGQLMALAETNGTARKMFQLFTGRTKNSKVTYIDGLSAQLDEAEGPIRQVFQVLQSLGLGELLLGRKGHRTRFAWSAPLTQIGRIAMRTEDAPKEIGLLEGSEIDEEPSDESSSALLHRFHMRPNFEVSIKLPTDFNPTEAERLGLFIRAIARD